MYKCEATQIKAKADAAKIECEVIEVNNNGTGSFICDFGFYVTGRYIKAFEEIERIKAMPKKKKKNWKQYRCTVCAGQDIIFDAMLKWDIGKNRFVVHQLDDTEPAFCSNCSEQVKVESFYGEM